jgi:hypothetical protein
VISLRSILANWKSREGIEGKDTRRSTEFGSYFLNIWTRELARIMGAFVYTGIWAIGNDVYNDY